MTLYRCKNLRSVHICTICHIMKYLSPPAHQIWVTDPLQAGTAAGTSFTEKWYHPNASAASVRGAQKPLKAVLIHRIDIRQLHLGCGHWYKDISRPNTILIFDVPLAASSCEKRCDCKEENCGSVGHRTVWPHQHWLWMSHSEIVRYKNIRPKSPQHSVASVEGISLKNNHQYGR